MAAQNADELRTEAEKQREVADALVSLRKDLKESESVGETPLSGLFHAARTTSPRHYNGITVTLNYNRETEEWDVGSPIKRQRGESLLPSARKKHDAVLNVGIQPFMDRRTFVGWVDNQLRDAAAQFSGSAQMKEQDAKAMGARQ